MNDPTHDVFLLSMIVVFSILKAVLIRREGWLGRAIFWANVMYAIAFGYRLATMHWPWMDDEQRIVTGIRVLLALALAWGIFQILRARYLRWQRNGGARTSV